MSGDLGLGGSEAGGLGDAGYGPSGSPYGDSGYSGNYNTGDFSASLGGGNYSSPGEMDQAAANFNAIANEVAAAEASGLQAGAYSPAQLDAILGMLSEPVGENAASGKGFHSPGISYGLLASLDREGLGKMDIPGFGQNIEQALAANKVATAMGYIAPAIANLAPGFGTLSTIARVGAGLMSGTMTPGQAFATGLAGLIGAKTNIPSGILEGLFEGNLGKAAGSGAQAGLGALTTGLTGNPLAGALTSAALGPAVGRAVSDAVGGGSSKSGGLAGAVDRGLGTSNWGGLFGGSSAPSTSTAPTGNASGDAYGGIDPETYAVTAAIEQAAQEATQPSWKRETVAGRYGPTLQYEYGV